MLNQQTKRKEGKGGNDNLVTISSVSQYELVNAIYDSRILSSTKLTPSAKLVLIGIARHYNPAKQDCYPSYSFMCDHLGISKKSMERAIKELVSAGFITYRTQKVNRYRFTGHFFASVNLTVNMRQNDGSDMRQNDAQTNNHEQIKKKTDFLKNSFSGGDSQETDLQQEEMTCGVQSEETTKEPVSQVMIVEGRTPALPKNEKRIPDKRKKCSQPPTDGGSCRVPSVEETREYLRKSREARKFACSPREYDREAAKHWYGLLSEKMKECTTAQFLYKKYNGWQD